MTEGNNQILDIRARKFDNPLFSNE